MKQLAPPRSRFFSSLMCAGGQCGGVRIIEFFAANIRGAPCRALDIWEIAMGL